MFSRSTSPSRSTSSPCSSLSVRCVPILGEFLALSALHRSCVCEVCFSSPSPLLSQIPGGRGHWSEEWVRWWGDDLVRSLSHGPVLRWGQHPLRSSECSHFLVMLRSKTLTEAGGAGRPVLRCENPAWELSQGSVPGGGYSENCACLAGRAASGPVGGPPGGPGSGRREGRRGPSSC